MTSTSQSGAGKGEDTERLVAPDSGTIPGEYENGLPQVSTSTGGGSSSTNLDQLPPGGSFDVTFSNHNSNSIPQLAQSDPTPTPGPDPAQLLAYSQLRRLLKTYLRQVGVEQKELARALGWEAGQFSRKLHLKRRNLLVVGELKSVIRALAELGALTYQWQALELLQTLYPEQDFAREEWRSTPLNRLDPPRFKGGLVAAGTGAGPGQFIQSGRSLAVEVVQNQPGAAVVADTVEVGDAVIQPGEKRPKSQLGRGVGGSARRGIKFVGPGLDEGGVASGREQHDGNGGGTGAADWDEGSEDGTPGLLPLTTGVPLIGRDKELEQAREWLVDKDSPIRVLTIAGPGGVGKTSLALALARQLSGTGEYPDGVVWVDLATLPAGATPRELNEAIAHAMGLTQQVGVAVADQIRNYLAGKRLLVVLDNFEQLQRSDTALILQRLTGNNPGLRVVVTSRHLLKLPANSQTLKLAPLTYPKVGESLPPVVELAGSYSAVELFVRQARLLEPYFALGESNAGAVVELCQRLDGVPLALAIAAARVSQFGVAGVLDRINRHGALLMLEDAGQGEERHQSQTTTIGWSYDLLTDEERRVWRGLAVFAGSVGIEAIERVLGDGLSAVEMDTRIVGGLVDKSMLFRVEDSMVVGPGAGGSVGIVGAGESRYYVHGVMREYALERVREQAGEEDKVREAHARYYLGLAEEAAPRLNGPDRAGWQARLGIEYENVKAALDCLVEKSMVEEAYRLVGAMGQYWFNNRLTAEGQTWLERVLGLAGAGEVGKAIRARALFEAGRMAMALEDWGKARAWSEESLAIWRELGNDEGLGRVLTNLGNIGLKVEDFEIARGYYEQALGYAEKLGNKVGLAVIIRNIGYIALRQNDLAKAKQFYQQSLELSQETGNRQEVVICWMNLGLIALKQGDLSEAQTFSYQTLLATQQAGDWLQEIYALLHLGEIAAQRNAVADLKKYYGKGLELCLRHSVSKFVPVFLLNIAAALVETKAALLSIARLLGIVDHYAQDKSFLEFDAEDKALHKRVKSMVRSQLQEFDFLEAWMEGQELGSDLKASIEQGLIQLGSLL